MKSDSYLNLCIEQARLSPLHYRHGSIVVKGGKVIGQGFNDYRPGYDGGSVLKSGVMPKSASPSVDCTAPDKNSDPPKLKLKASTSSKPKFKPVESVSGNCGGMHHSNASLSMHSEMMAINSALASSSTLAARTPSPPMPAPSASPLRAARMLSSNNNASARLRPTSGVLKPVHLDATTYQKLDLKKHQQEQQNHNRNQKQKQKQKQKRQNTEMYTEQYQHKHGYKYKQYKSHKKSHLRALMRKTVTHVGASDDDHVRPDSVKAPLDSDSSTGAFGQPKARNRHLLVPKGRAGSSTSGMKGRMKHPKLVGADVYVMRLARPCAEPSVRKRLHEKGQQNDENLCKNESDSCSKSSGLSSSTGSLHDELSCKAKDPDPPIAKSEKVGAAHHVAESRPCYRCITYMHSVGIKRVFWTTNEGKWEGAKVRDLIDHLEGAMASQDSPLELPVFVTKHEVLLLQRLMASGER